MSKEVSHYVVTAHPPGAVLFSTQCNFLAPDAKNVVLARPRSLEVRQYVRHNDEPVFQLSFQTPINGRITSLLSFQMEHSPTSYVFFTTDTLHYAVVSYDARSSPYPLRTHASGFLQVHNTKPAESGPIVALDSRRACITLHVVDGFVHVIPIDARYRPQQQRGALKSSGFDDGGGGYDDEYNRKPRAAAAVSSVSSLLGEPFHCRLEEARVLAMAFVPTDTSAPLPPKSSSSSSSYQPLLAVLHQDARGGQHLISHAVNLHKRQLHLYGSTSAQTKAWIKRSNVDGGSALLIPVPPPPPPPRRVATAAAMASSMSGGDGNGCHTGTAASWGQHQQGAVMILGQKQWTYVSATSTKVIPVAQALYLTYEVLPPDPQTSSPRYLIGDEFGNLHMLTLLMFHSSPPSDTAPQLSPDPSAGNAASSVATAAALVRLQMDTLGSCAIASTTSYLDHGVVFVGSVLGDSQLVQISDEPIEEDAEMLESTYLSVIEEYTNLGPILDLDIMDHGPGLATRQVVTASGTSQSGSLRLIRNGIGMNESAAVEIPGIQAMWNVKGTNGTGVDAYLVQSFVSETRVLGVMGDGLEEVLLPGLDATCSSLFVGNVGRSALILQVTPREVRLFDPDQGTIWDTHPADITVASGNTCQVATALRGGKVLVFTVDMANQKLVLVGEKQMDREISCIDLHPFRRKCKDESTMDVDDDDTDPKSEYVAVGLWDDFTVRLLSASSLQELLCINLEEEEAEESSSAPAPRRSHNNVMARSLCLLTLDFNTSGSAAGSSVAPSSNAGTVPGVEMLFVGLGDGTLISFAVVAHPDGTLSVRSRKEVCLGTQRIDLVPLHTERGATCVFATGDRPTVIYLAGVGGTSSSHANPKLCYSNVNLSSSDDEGGDEASRLPAQQSIAVNVATPFVSPILFDTLGSQHYSLCVADDTHLRLGVIDDIQKLHVTTCRLGMAPRRIAHCASGRLFAVGCVESGINHVGLSENEGSMTNCIRFMDETTFDDIERVDLEPFEMLLSLAYVTLTVPEPGKRSTDGLRPSSEGSTPVYKPFLLAGTAFAIPDEDEPTRGRILVYSFQNDDSVASPSRAVRLVTEMGCNGGVYSICQFYEGKVLCSVNTKTMICQLVDDTGVNRLDYVGTGHHGHILSLCVKSQAKRVDSDRSKASSGTMMDDQVEEKVEENTEMLAIVGDLMRSVSLVQYYPEHEALEEIARDFNPNWTTACEMLNKNVYLAAENFHNMFCLRRNHASSEEVRCRLDTIGEYHLGEQINKFVSGSLIMPVSSNSTPSDEQRCRRAKSPKKSPNPRPRRSVVVTGSQVLYGTVEGTLGAVLGLDGRTAAFFSTLERAIADTIKPVGGLTHEMFRAVKGQNRSYPSHGFVDGDLVETFLDLDRALMEEVVKAMNRDGGWEVDDAVLRDPGKRPESGNDEQDEEQARSDLTVDEVLAMVEEISMLH
jgi:DNA damage-binding protein 1